MKKLLIEWKHFDKDGKTCERCKSTGTNLKEVISELKIQLQDKGFEMQSQEIRLTERQMYQSNSVLLNGVPIENVLEDISVFENTCTTCSNLTGNSCSCRAIQIKDLVHDEIPKDLLKKAILKRLNQYFF